MLNDFIYFAYTNCFEVLTFFNCLNLFHNSYKFIMLIFGAMMRLSELMEQRAQSQVYLNYVES